MLLQSFDNYHEERVRRRKEYLERLEREREEVQKKIENAESNAFEEAVKKVSTEMSSKKEQEINDIKEYNKKQIEELYQKIEAERYVQAEHYAKLFGQVMGYFIPEWSKKHGIGELVDCLRTLLDSCKERTLVISTNKKMMEYLEGNLDIGNKRISFTENDNIQEGKIEIGFDGGGAEIDFESIKHQMIREIEKMTDENLENVDEIDIIFKE